MKSTVTTKDRLSRRGFLAAGIPLLWAPLFEEVSTTRISARHKDPRLTARPRQPNMTAPRGAVILEPDEGRGGILYVPEQYHPTAPAPLIVALLGGGGQARSWERLYEPCEEHGIVLLAPESRGRTWDAIQGMFGPDVVFLDSALEYVFARCAIDPKKIALAGFSDGASYALSLGPSNGDLFSELIAFSPGFSYPEEPIIGRPKVFISHGSEDRVLPVTLSRDGIAPMFDMDGYTIRYEEFTGGHEMPPEVVTKALDWFLESEP